MEIFYLFKYNIGIFYKDFEWAENLIYEYYNKLQKEMIKFFRKENTHDYLLCLKNGCYIRTFGKFDCCRWHRFDRVIIQDTIDKKIRESIVYPSVLTKKVFILDNNYKGVYSEKFL